MSIFTLVVNLTLRNISQTTMCYDLNNNNDDNYPFIHPISPTITNIIYVVFHLIDPYP